MEEARAKATEAAVAGNGPDTSKVADIGGDKSISEEIKVPTVEEIMKEKKAQARLERRKKKQEIEEMSVCDKAWMGLKWLLTFLFVVFMFKMRIMKK